MKNWLLSLRGNGAPNTGVDIPCDHWKQKLGTVTYTRDLFYNPDPTSPIAAILCNRRNDMSLTWIQLISHEGKQEQVRQSLPVVPGTPQTEQLDKLHPDVQQHIAKLPITPAADVHFLFCSGISKYEMQEPWQKTLRKAVADKIFGQDTKVTKALIEAINRTLRFDPIPIATLAVSETTATEARR